IVLYYLIFFFQAEDGIRDSSVTGVQTCALPIFASAVDQPVQDMIAKLAKFLGSRVKKLSMEARPEFSTAEAMEVFIALLRSATRSEERRVGKESRSREAPHHE